MLRSRLARVAVAERAARLLRLPNSIAQTIVSPLRGVIPVPDLLRIGDGSEQPRAAGSAVARQIRVRRWRSGTRRPTSRRARRRSADTPSAAAASVDQRRRRIVQARTPNHRVIDVELHPHLRRRRRPDRRSTCRPTSGTARAPRLSASVRRSHFSRTRAASLLAVRGLQQIREHLVGQFHARRVLLRDQLVVADLSDPR